MNVIDAIHIEKKLSAQMKELKVATSLLSKGQARRAWTVDGSIVIDNIIFADLTDLSPKSHGNT